MILIIHYLYAIYCVLVFFFAVFTGNLCDSDEAIRTTKPKYEVKKQKSEKKTQKKKKPAKKTNIKQKKNYTKQVCQKELMPR